MTDNENKPTYDELVEELAVAKGANTRLRAQFDEQYNSAREWKAEAEKLRKERDIEQKVASDARVEAAELRGYIKRVNELDPKSVRQKRADPRDVERLMRRGY